jgi:hypothetical protein
MSLAEESHETHIFAFTDLAGYVPKQLRHHILWPLSSYWWTSPPVLLPGRAFSC